MVLKLCLTTQIDANLGVNEMSHLHLWVRPQRSHIGDRSVRHIPNQWVACNRIGRMWCTTNSLSKQGMYSTFESSSVCVVLGSRTGDTKSRYGMSFPTKIVATLQRMFHAMPKACKHAYVSIHAIKIKGGVKLCSHLRIFKTRGIEFFNQKLHVELDTWDWLGPTLVHLPLGYTLMP